MTPLNLLMDRIAALIASNLTIAAPVVAFLAAYILYGVLGKRVLGADDDFWEAIRAFIIPVLEGFARSRGLYVHTKTSRNEFAGLVEMGEEEFERKLKAAGFLRQPLASMHRNERGWQEDGSWARTHGPLLPIGRVLSNIPAAGGMIRRFLTALDTVLARRQTHIIFYTQKKPSGQTNVYVYAHDELNPINPLTAFQHYQGIGFRAAPEMAKTALATVGIELTKAG